MSKYSKNCKIQEHDEEECYVLHPELYLKGGEEETRKAKVEDRDKMGERIMVKTKIKKISKNKRGIAVISQFKK